MRGTDEGGKTLTNMIKLVRTHKENLLLYDQISKLDRWHVLSPMVQLIIITNIFEKVSFADIRSITHIDRTTIRANLQKLFDLGSLDGEWKKSEKTKTWEIYYSVNYDSKIFADNLLIELIKGLDK
jgi:hypothetical protein